MKKEIIKYSIILFVGFLIEWWLFDFSGLQIPKYIYNTPINIEGLLLLVLLASVIYFLIRSVLQLNHRLPIWKLALIGGVVCFMAEIAFQLIRQISIYAEGIQERLYYFFIGTFAMSLFATIFAFVIAALIISKETKR